LLLSPKAEIPPGTRHDWAPDGGYPVNNTAEGDFRGIFTARREAIKENCADPIQLTNTISTVRTSIHRDFSFHFVGNAAVRV
jgi:hypothetical protein